MLVNQLEKTFSDISYIFRSWFNEKSPLTIIAMHNIFFYYSSICVINDGASRRLIRNYCFQAIRTYRSTNCSNKKLKKSLVLDATYTLLFNSPSLFADESMQSLIYFLDKGYAPYTVLRLISVTHSCNCNI